MNSQLSFNFLSSYFTFLLCLAVCLSSCEDPAQLPEPNPPSENGKANTSNGQATKTFYGPAVSLGQGVARAWVSTDKQGTPLSVGVNISEHAIQSLMDEREENHENAEHKVFTLKLPKQAESTLYDHMTLDWNPHGHPAPGIYDLPHFDLHAYMISEEERLAIPPLAPFDESGAPQYDEEPAPAFIPEDYFLEPGIVPAMGAHWLDSKAPEFQGETFTRTFIYGSLDGTFIFHEPMFTVAYLNELKQKAHPFESLEIKQPQRYQKTGYYPLEYSFTYNPRPGEYKIALDNLIYKNRTLP